MDLTIVAYATLALSLFVSAVKMGGWILNADPRAIINSGRWALIALAALALGVLVWLIATGRWTSAMMLAAFMLPVFVQAAPRWRVLFGPLNAARGDFAAGAQNFGNVPASFSTPRQGPDPELVRQSIACCALMLNRRDRNSSIGLPMPASRAQPGTGAATGEPVCRGRRRSTSWDFRRARARKRSARRTAGSGSYSIRSSAALVT
jgi:hypothetical protein